jgi:hypothetical protein
VGPITSLDAVKDERSVAAAENQTPVPLQTNSSPSRYLHSNIANMML